MANQGLLTVGDIIEQGCQQGGNPGLLVVPAGETVSFGIKAFRTLLHHIYLNYDLPMLETEASISTTATPSEYEISLSSITRYRSINAVYLKNGNTSIGRIEQVDYKTLWFRLQEDLAAATTPKGTPTVFCIIPDRSKILVHPIPDAALTGKILYYRIPDVSAYVEATTAATLDFEDTLMLVKAMEAFARDWDANNMVGLSTAIAERMFGQYRVAAEDQGRSGGPIQVKLGSRFNYRRGD